MQIIDDIQASHAEFTALRRDIHAHPELGFEETRTSTLVANKLREWGYEATTGLGKTGVVGTLKRGNSPRSIGIRADMDALPMQEANTFGHHSSHPSRMHACGHDGHTTILLAAAKHLATHQNFDGTLHLIFQPAEEGGAGALAMVEDGLMERFGINEVYGMHNMPGIPLGAFAIRKGGIMAAPDKFSITVKGRGGHAAQPHRTIDPITIGAQIVGNLQMIASRNADPIRSVVVSVTRFHAGSSHNIIPNEALIAGTVRSLDETVRDLAQVRIKQMAEGIALANGAEAEVVYERYCPVTFNHSDETDHAIRVARDVVGEPNVDPDVDPSMAGEDFSFMLKERPGAFIFLGNGDSAGLHNPGYDFNDEAIAYGISYWVKLAEQRLTS